MRQDIYQVIHETARSKFSKSRSRRVRLADGEVLDPVRESMREPHRFASKNRNLNLAPLRRFIESRVGRPWSQVFSEMCHALQKRDRLLDDPMRYLSVETHTWVEDGKILCQNPWKGVCEVSSCCEFYVHPVSGLLCRNPVNHRAAQRKQYRLERETEKRARRVDLTDTLQLHLVEGVWYAVELAALPSPDEEAKVARELHDPATWRQAAHRARELKCLDVVLGHLVHRCHRHLLMVQYGKLMYAKAKRQLNHKELRDYGLLEQRAA